MPGEKEKKMLQRTVSSNGDKTDTGFYQTLTPVITDWRNIDFEL
jgi:hypothetical protein